MSKQPEAIPAVRWKPERARHPEAANSSPLMDTINIALKINRVKYKFLIKIYILLDLRLTFSWTAAYFAIFFFP